MAALKASYWYAKDLSTEERFFRHVIKTDRCWLWDGHLNPNGYGYFAMSPEYRCHASRASWIIHNGPIESRKIHVCHKCDNPACVRPDHLFLGSHQENMDDMWSKNRGARGSRHGRSKLSEEEIREIFSIRRKRYIAGQELAKMYGVSSSMISTILSRKKWKHLQRGGDLSRPQQ